MAGKKGMKRYPEEYRQKVQAEYKAGMGIRELSRKYGGSKYAVQSWCGLRKEVELRHAAPLPKDVSTSGFSFFICR